MEMMNFQNSTLLGAPIKLYETTQSNHWAKAKVDAANGNTVIVCKDDLRAMLHNSAHSSGREKFIKVARNALILTALSDGKNVIVADTNYDYHESDIRALVAKWSEDNNKNVQVKIQDFSHVPIEVCIERDSNRPNSLGEKVIRDQYNRWIKKDEKPDMIPWDFNKKSAVVFDIDGTLTTGPKDRSPFDWSKVGQDDVNFPVRSLLQLHHFDGNNTIIKFFIFSFQLFN